MSEHSPLQFDDLQEYVASQLGTEGWLTVYEFTKRDREEISYYCALVTPEGVERCLANTSRDLLIGAG